MLFIPNRDCGTLFTLSDDVPLDFRGATSVKQALKNLFLGEHFKFDDTDPEFQTLYWAAHPLAGRDFVRLFLELAS